MPKYGYITETIEKPIDPGEGWELLPCDDNATVRGGDEYLDPVHGWRPCGGACLGYTTLICTGAFNFIPAFRRRKPQPRYGFTDDGKPISVGGGYELVPEGEVLREGDEWEGSPAGWAAISSFIGRRASLHPNNHTVTFHAFRRKKAPRYGFMPDGTPVDVGNGWQLVPKSNLPIMAGDEYLRSGGKWTQVNIKAWLGLSVSDAALVSDGQLIAIRRRLAPIRHQNNPKTFWLVWNPSKPKPPAFRHSSPASVKSEAMRLSRRNPGGEFFVLEACNVTRDGRTTLLD